MAYKKFIGNAISGIKSSVQNTAISKALGQAQGLISGASDGFSGAQGKVAAQLLKKSPMEIPDSPQEKLKRNPLGFSTVQYPLDLGSNELGHYIIFYMEKISMTSAYEDASYSNELSGSPHAGTDSDKSTTLQARKKGATKLFADGEVNSKLPSSVNTSAAISIYMPPGLKATYGQNYESEATNLSGDVLAGIDQARSAEDSAGKIEGILSGVVGGGARYAKTMIGDAISIAGAGDPVRLAMKRTGLAMNPREEQFYNAPEFRTFEYVFDFWPRSKEEVKVVHDIIFLFKYHSAPELSTEGAGAMFHIPNKFSIQYMHNSEENTYLNKIAGCYLKNVAVDYGPEGQNSFFGDGGAPVHTKLSLSFVEDTYITKDDITQGY